MLKPPNRKQHRFILEYLKDLNATQAAIRAGYSNKTAHVIGPRLLGNVSVSAEIEIKTAEKAAEMGVTVDKIVKEAALIAFSDLSEMLSDCDTIKNPREWAESTRRGIESFEITRTKNGENETVRKKIKTWNKVACLEFLGRYMGMLKDKGDSPTTIVLNAPEIERASPNG